MYNQDPHWLIPTVYMASDRLFYHHITHHIDAGKRDVEASSGEEESIARAALDYQFYFGGRLRKEDIANSLQCWRAGSSEETHRFVIKKLVQRFLVWRGNGFEVKREQLESWLVLCSVFDPAWIIAAGYAELYHSSVLSERDVTVLLTGNQCPFAFPFENNHVHYADNHVHFNGHGYTSLSMLSFIERSHVVHDGFKWPYRQEYTYFESQRLQKENLPHWLCAYTSSLLNLIFNHQASIDHGQLSLDLSSHLTGDQLLTLDDIKSLYQPATAQQRILSLSTVNDLTGHAKWLLFCFGLMVGKEQPSYQLVLNNLIRGCNILRNYMVVSSLGLGQFMDFFGAARMGVQREKKFNDTVNFDNQPSVYREYRVGSDFLVGRKKKPNIYHHQLTDFFTQHDAINKAEHAHIVVHFSRRLAGAKRTDKRVDATRGKLFRLVREFEKFSTSLSMQQTVYQPDITAPGTNIDVRKLVRGYDVAGNENDLPIEVFAPALRVLRAAKYSAGEHWSIRLPRPFITVHAGEDYGHLLCGLRAIDEAVEFCQLGEGDRIGHGLALGVDAIKWAREQKRAYITAGQHIDNLVWAYHQAVKLSQHTAAHIPVMHELRDKIHHWSQRIFKDIYTPNLLYQAWLLRRNWPDYANLESISANRLEWAPDWDALQEDHTASVKNVTAYRLWQRYLNSGLHEKDPASRIICINCCPNDTESYLSTLSEDEDFISQGELKLYEAIQDYLTEKYSRLGLVFEACPTSNIYIGRFEKYHEHPLFRWNPPNPEWLATGGKFNQYGLRSGPLAVCLNTDDSALMPTTIANEHRLIRECCIQHYGIGSWMADLWIDAIRQKGMMVFRANHLMQDDGNHTA